MVTFWLLIDTIAMIGSPASRGAAPSVVCSGGARRGAASAGGAAVSAVRAAVAASVTIVRGAHRRTTSVDWAVVHRFVMPCPGCQGGNLLLSDRRRMESRTAPAFARPYVIFGFSYRSLTSFSLPRLREWLPPVRRNPAERRAPCWRSIRYPIRRPAG